MKHIRKWFGFALIVLAIGAPSLPALAIVDAQILVGQRNTAIKSDDTNTDDKIKGTEVGLAVHVNPIPVVPVGIGLFYNTTTYDVDSDSTDPEAFTADKFTGSEYGLEVSAGIRLVKVKPYVKIGYLLGGSYKGTLEDVNLTIIGKGNGDVSATYDVKGTYFGLGLGFSVAPLFGIMLEAKLSQQELEFDKLTYPDGSTDSSQDIEYDFNSTTILLGLELNI